MKAHVDYDFVNESYKVWFFERGAPGTSRVLRFPSPGTLMWDEVPDGAEAPLEPSLELPEEAVELMIEKLSKVLPPDAAQAQHLKDAREVRDRLLAMIETRGIR